MTTDPPAETHDPPSAVAGTVDATPRAVTTNRIYERVRSVYLTADLRSLAAGRIVLALVLLRDLVGRWLELGIWYTNDGIIPNHTMLWRPPWDHVFSLFYLASYKYEAAIGFVICLSCTRRCWSASTKLAQIAATICMMQPSRPHAAVRQRRRRRAGPADDLDDVPADGPPLLRRRRAGPPPRGGAGACAGRRRPGPPVANERAKSFVSLGVLAVIAQLAIIYFFNAAHKTGRPGATAARSTTRSISIGWRPGSPSGCGTTCRRRSRAG